jgi:hypothetical protein
MTAQAELRITKIGTPAKHIDEWFDTYAASCFHEAKTVMWPLSIKYKWRGEAFKEAAELVRRAKQQPMKEIIKLGEYERDRTS